MNFIKRFFRRKPDAKKIILVLEKIKAVSNMALVDVITSLSPTPADDLIVAGIRKYLPSIIEGLMIIDDMRGCKNYQDETLITACLLQKVSKLNRIDRGKHLLKLAARILSEHTGMKEDKAIAIIQNTYDRIR